MLNTMSIADELNTLVNCKEDMKSALIEKGVTPEGGLSTYADAIDKIQTGLEEKYVGLKFSNSYFTEAPNIDTSLYTDMSYMFNGCTSLESVPELNCSNVENVLRMFSGCEYLKNIKGLKNLGMKSNLSGTETMLFDCVRLTIDSVKNLFYSLYNRGAVLYPVVNIYLPENIFDYESEYVKQQTIAIAVNKGWSVSW